MEDELIETEADDYGPDEEGSGHEATELDSETKISLLDVLDAPNLVPLLDAADVGKIGSAAQYEFEIDLESCKEFHERYDRAMVMAMQERKPKTFPWPGASNVIYPLLTQASIQFQARAYPAIIDGPMIVKGRVLGPDPDGTKRQRADRIGAHMSWQFLNDVPGWEEDTDKLLLQLPIVGCVFRKTWHDPIRQQNNSETVTAKDLVVNYKTASFEKAPRFTHVQRYYPHEIEAFIRTGLWEKIHYQGDDGNDPHSIVEILEQHRLIDMDGDGLPEPYVVIMTRDGEVARIAACFDADGIFYAGSAFDGQKSLPDVMADKNLLTEDLKIVRVERKEYFTKYGFIPAPDGSFYDIGFGTLTENLGAAVNTIINQLIDAGTLSNMQGGFIAGGTKIRGGNMTFTPGEWKRVEGVTSGPLRDNIMPLALPGPSPVLFQLLGMLIEAVKGITSVSDILTGNQESQTAPTTALALIQEGQKVFTAIYQRVHRALGCEIRNMAALNRDYLDEQTFFELLDTPAQVGRADYQDRDLDVQPFSDPRAMNDQVKMAKAQMLMAHNGDPLVNQVEIRRREFEAAGIPDIKTLLDVPAPAPAPEMLQKQAEMANTRDKTKAEIRERNANTAKTLIEAATLAYQLGTVIADPAIATDAAQMLHEAIELADSISQEMKEADNGQPLGEPGGVPGMEGTPDDAGVSPVPEGPGEPVEPALGAGAPVGDQGTVAGGDDGGSGIPVGQ